MQLEYSSYKESFYKINANIISDNSNYGYEKIIDNYENNEEETDLNKLKGERNILRHMINAVSHSSISFDGTYFTFIDVNKFAKTKKDGTEVNSKMSFKMRKDKIGKLIGDLLGSLELIIEQIKQRQAESKSHG